MVLYLCPSCNGIVTNHENHHCGFYKNIDNVISLPESIVNDKVERFTLIEDETAAQINPKHENPDTEALKKTEHSSTKFKEDELFSRCFTQKEENYLMSIEPYMNAIHEDMQETTLLKEKNTTTGSSGTTAASVGAKRSVFFCHICHKLFERESIWVRHCLSHGVKRQYSCDKCGEQISNSKQQIRAHIGEKTYVCTNCEKAVAQKDCLDYHFQKRTDEKPYVCDICKNEFVQKHELDNHVLIHIVEKPLECDFCKRRFRFKSNLDRHISIHTGEKPYVCDICQKAFARKSHIDYHITTHTAKKAICMSHMPKKLFVCHICQKRFRHKSSQNRHVKTHTG